MNDQQQPKLPPPNYLVWAILTTILCCPPIGIVSIIFAAQVNSKWVAGDYIGAQNSSKNAKIWVWVSFAAGICIAIIWTLIVFTIGLAAIGLEVFDF